MTLLRRVGRRILNFITNRHRNARLNEEIEAHLGAQTDENIQAGMSPGEAARQARLKFGAVETVRAEYHDEASLPLLEDLLRDGRYALRVLAKSPAFTLVAVLSLMLGIGANVVVFGVVNAVLLHPLEVSDPANLYQVRHQAWAKGRLLTTSYPAFRDFQQRATAFSGMAGYYGYSSARLHWQHATRDVSGVETTGNYFDLLGVQPAVGRFFHAADERGANSAPYVVLSDALWRSEFQADPGIVGTAVQLDKASFTVIGVAPARFHGTEQFVWPDYWIPMVNEGQVEGWDYLSVRDKVAVTVLGRLKPGVTPRQATENLNAIAAELAQEYPQTDRGLMVRLIHPGLYGDNGDVIRGFLYSLAVLALLVLAAASANLASLFAARAADRRKELAVRVALGASRGRLVRQLLTEALVVSLLGGAAGLAAAGLLLGALNRWPSPYGQLAINVDARVYLAAVVLTVVSALLFGLVPARQVWQSDPLQAIKSGPVESVSVRGYALRDWLLCAQIAICTLLVTASLVAVRGMVRLLHAPLGFHPRGALLAEMDLSQLAAGSDAVFVKEQALLAAVQHIPGVTAAGAVSRVPMTGGMHGVPIFRPGTTEFTLGNAALSPYVLTMSPDYLQAAGTRLLDGRDVSGYDTAEKPFVAVVNVTFARQIWGNAPAIGQRFIVSNRLTEVVGVAEDGKYHDMTEAHQPAVYLPWSQSMGSNVVFVVRSLRTQREMAAALERTLTSLVPDTPVAVQSWPDALGLELFPAWAATVALSIMGLLAAMLAVTGIFGMAAYNVSRRMKELGIRIALGAPKARVLSAAIGRPLGLLGVGSLAGLLLSVFADQLLQQMVYQANPQDPVVLGGVVLTMALLGLAASTLPALRALAVDPSKLLREE
jgi:predicted permease